MVYITYQSPERYRQLSFEEMMSGQDFPIESLHMGGKGATHTVVVSRVPYRIMRITDVPKMVSQLAVWVETYGYLYNQPRNELYDHFKIPKKTGGLRPIDAPLPELKKALNQLKDILSGWMFADHHACAYAYVNERSVIEVAKKHQRFNGWWFAHFDFHGFFPSTTSDFILSQMKLIYPFNLILEDPRGKQLLPKALDLCMLNGGLPQGTPISPFLTNLMMIPFDHAVAKMLNKFDSGKRNADGTVITDRCCYTRYADDIDISCKVMFNYKKVERDIIALLQTIGAPFTINETKTQFNSRAGRNWILGVMLNKDNEITIGYRKNKIIKATIFTYLTDRAAGRKWTLSDLQHFRGNISWFHSVEPEVMDRIILKYNHKFGVDLMECISQDMHPGNHAPESV